MTYIVINSFVTKHSTAHLGVLGKDARLKRELQREQHLRDLHEAAAKREELWTRLEVAVVSGWSML